MLPQPTRRDLLTAAIATRLVAALLLALPLIAQAPDPAWQKLAFLTGKWTGSGENAQGDFSFLPDLNNHILIRRSQANAHSDLMVIYLDPTPRAIYFDNEGHTIHYTLTFPSPDTAVFEAPQFRLTYWMEKGVLQGKFEVGGKPYLTWSARRQ